MRTLALLAFLSFPVFGQPAFTVASVKLSGQKVGPDYNNKIVYSPDSISARNVTLKRLVMEAYRMLPHQVLGPGWVSDVEYDVNANADPPVTQQRMQQMLRTLLIERFGLEFHRAKSEMRVYVLSQAKGGARLRTGQTTREWDHFHGEVHEYAALLGVRLTMAEQSNPDPAKPMFAAGPATPVIDRTGLLGTYDFDVQLTQEAASDPVGFWQHALEDQLGLRLESRREHVETIVIDRAKTVPTGN